MVGRKSWRSAVVVGVVVTVIKEGSSVGGWGTSKVSVAVMGSLSDMGFD